MTRPLRFDAEAVVCRRMGNVETACDNVAPHVTGEGQLIREVQARDCPAHSLSILSNTYATYTAKELPAPGHALATPLDTTTNQHSRDDFRSVSRENSESLRLAAKPPGTEPGTGSDGAVQFEQATTVSEQQPICGDCQRSSELLLFESRKSSKPLTSGTDDMRPMRAVANSSFGVHENACRLGDPADDTPARASGLARVAQTQLPLFLQRAIAAQRSRGRRHSEVGDNVEALKLLRHPLSRYVDERDRRM